MKVLSVVGARPEFIKLAPIAHEFNAHDVEHVVVHTGQHYDPMLSDVFFSDLKIPDADEHLDVGSGGHGRQTGEMLARLDDVLIKHEPDWVLAYGDTNSTIAGALSAVKLHFRVAHLEAGLRSFNRRMPEEHNRILTDHASDLCLAPTELAMAHLAAEGLAAISVNVGDVHVDVLEYVKRNILTRHPRRPLGPNPGDYLVATIHRAESTDDPDRLGAIIDALASLPTTVALLAHPRLKKRASEFGIDLHRGAIRVEEPLSYPDLIAAVMESKGVITDSGGLQKEAFLLRVPCITVRTETEWVETIDLGWNVLANTRDEIVAAVGREWPAPTDAAPYGNGDASSRVRAALTSRM